MIIYIIITCFSSHITMLFTKNEPIIVFERKYNAEFS